MHSNQLISFYVIACNQERFIAEAIEGAFAQTWTPLEIVLSDDCSDDNTFKIMQELAAAYAGPHKIILNRNKKRLGIGAHINRLMDLCTADWIVASAGDDISLPERTTTLFSHWKSDGGNAALIYSNLYEINEDGSDSHILDFRNFIPGGKLKWNYSVRLAGGHIKVHGAGFAYPRTVFSQFGPLWDGVVFEDNVLNWRAELTGGVLLCPEPLVRHRNHGGQITNLYSRQALIDANYRRRLLQWSDIVTRKENIADVQVVFEQGLITKEILQNALHILNKELLAEENTYQLFWGTFIQRWRLLLSSFGKPRRRVTQLLFAGLPRPVYLMALRIASKLKKSADT